jgi:hypothetical protein
MITAFLVPTCPVLYIYAAGGPNIRAPWIGSYMEPLTLLHPLTVAN